MIILNKKKKIKRLQEITERQEKQVRSLNSWLETFLAKENEIRKEYSINLEKVNEIKRKLDSISDFNLYEKCECFIKKIDDSGVPEPYSNSSYVLKLYVKKDSIGVFSSILAGRNFEHEIILPCGGVIEPLKTPYVDDSIGKIVLECTYSGNKQINQIVI